MNYSSQMEMIPIASLNALEYCPRKFYYQYVQGEMPDNELAPEGTRTTARGEMPVTRLYLSSETLRLTGFVDVFEERTGVLVPVIFKHGRPGQWPGDQIQLCAQALCLEERQPDKAPLASGYIYDTASGRRAQVRFTQHLRARTQAAIAEALRVSTLAGPPPPLTGSKAARCPQCSLFFLCLPQEVTWLRSR